MCVIVFKPKDVTPPTHETLTECWRRNSDGGGVMWQEKGSLKVRKGFMTLPEMLKAIDKIPPNCAAVYHFRIGTHGVNTAENTHPWPIEGHGAALCHNGIISWLTDDRATSDSKRFADFVSRMDGNVLYNQDLKKVFEDLIGNNNKIVVMDDENYTILNEKSGIWDGGIWYSNSSYQIYKVPVHQRDYESWQQDKQPLIFDCIKSVDLKQNQVELTFQSGEVVHMHKRMFINNYNFYDYTKSLAKKIDAIINSWSKTWHSG